MGECSWQYPCYYSDPTTYWPTVILFFFLIIGISNVLLACVFLCRIPRARLFPYESGRNIYKNVPGDPYTQGYKGMSNPEPVRVFGEFQRGSGP